MKRRKKESPDRLPEELGKAISLHQNGKLQQAKLIYKKIIRQAPTYPDALHMLGILYSQTDKLDSAINYMLKSLRFAPGRADFLFNLARAYHDNGDIDHAINSYQKYLAIIADDAEALHWLGRAWQDKSDFEQAIVYYQKALETTPGRIDTLNSLGVMLNEQGEFDQAIKCYKKALKYQPDDYVVLNNLGDSLRGQGMSDQATVCFRQALALRPDYSQSLNNLGILLREEGKLTEAVELFQKALAIDPDSGVAFFNLGLVLSQQGQYDRAADSFQKALSIEPDYLEALIHLGDNYIIQGDFENGMTCFHKALSIEPDYLEALMRLGNNYIIQGDFENGMTFCQKAFALDPDNAACLATMARVSQASTENNLIADMEKVFSSKDLEDEDKKILAFSLGKAWAENGDYDKSFFYISEGNRLHRNSYEYSTSEDEYLFGQFKKIYNKNHISKHVDGGNSDVSPIFILGMPRSGTTLVEQILASHPRVFGAGELEDLRDVIPSITGKKAQEEVFEEIASSSKGFYGRFASEYLRRTLKYSGSADFVTDKMPHNFLWIGAIALALPNARIIHCKREPMDNCFSIYKNLFGTSHRYAYDLQELGCHYLLYKDLMCYWHQLFPGKIYDIRYEDIIDDQEGQTRRLLNHCELDWDERCLSFYNTLRNVKTLSQVQVRKPIYRDSVRLWKKYESHLGALQVILSGE